MATRVLPGDVGWAAFAGIGRLLAVPVVGLACALTMLGCPQPTPADAGDPGPEDAGVVVDAGNDIVDAGEADGGATDAGPPPTLFERVQALCIAHLQGQQNAQGFADARATRCSAVEPLPDHVVDPALLVTDLIPCLPGQPTYDLYEDALTGGRAVVDEEAVLACTAAARALRAAMTTYADAPALETALETLAEGQTCASLVTSALSAGDACVHAWDCPTGTACEADPLDAPGLTCLAPAPLGAACASGNAQSTAVRTCVSGAACFDGICVVRKPVNQVCGPGQVPCETALVCGPESVCTAPVGAGGACQNDTQCATSLRCAGASPGVAGLCAPLVDDGTACDSDAACAALCSVCRPAEVGGAVQCLDRGAGGAACLVDDHCREGFVCSGAGTCTPFLGLGEPCGGEVPCAPIFTCALDDASDGGVALTSTCVSPALIGSPCAGGENPCQSGACVADVCVAGIVGDPCVVDGNCRDENLCVLGACTVAPREDGACTADGRCAVGLVCEDGRCAGLPDVGDACPIGLCSDSAFCEQGTCAAKRASGGACIVDGECQGGVCLATGTCAATTPSCLSTNDAFTVFMIFALVGPLRFARRRTRASA